MDFISKDIIKDLIKETLFPPLNQRRFKKNAFTWHMNEDEIIKVVNIQFSKFNSANDSSFTINLGVFHPEFHAVRGSLPSSKNIKEYDCDVRIRIGKLMGKTDHWWDIAWNKDNEKVKSGFKYNVDKHVIPWVDTRWNLEKIYNHYVENKRDFDAAVAAYLLKNDNLNDHLLKALNEVNVGFKSTMKRWMTKHNISV